LDAGKSARIGELPKGKVGPLAQLVEQRTFNSCRAYWSKSFRLQM
jgi:hypothetical protein